MSAFAESTRLAKHAVRGRRGVVAAQNRKAALVGAAILDEGGDAVDAAIATSMALAATEPWMSGIGGGATMLIHRADTGKTHAVDGGMVAPKALDPGAYPLTGEVAGDLFGWPQVQGDRNLKGPMAMAAPGGLAALGLAHETFGRLPLAELLAPAERLAAQGLEIDWFSALLIATAARDLRDFASSAAVYLPDGLPPAPADAATWLPLGALAESFAQIGREGTESLYRGGLAERVASDLAELGSPLALADLAACRAELVTPLSTRHRTAEVLAMPGLYAGRTLLGCLEALADEPLAGDRPDAAAYRGYARVVRDGYARRLERDGHAAVADGPAGACTSHLAVIDAAGNMVSLTQTLLSLFGAKVVLPRTGILMNNGVMWFDPRPGRPNSMAPGRRPLSNMCPVIAHDGTRRIALGASGGRKIMPAVMQILSFVFDYGMTLEEAFAQPRIDVAGEGTVTMNRDLPDAVQQALAEAFAAVPARALAYPTRFACPVAVLHDLAEGDRHGTGEIRNPWADAVAQA